MSRTHEDKLLALKQEELALVDYIEKEDNMEMNLKHLLNIVDKLMDPSQGYSLGQIADTFNSLKVTIFLY